MNERVLTRVSLGVACGLGLWASGVIPAIIPQSVPTANKQGNSTKFQLAGTNSSTLGNLLCNDASGNATDSACGGAAAAVPFSGVTTGTNNVALHVGAGGSLDSAGTGTLTANGIRVYTVATLPAGVTGRAGYVSDGLTATDCTAGGGSTKVLCVYNGAAYAAIGGGGGGNTTTVGTYASLPGSSTTAGDQYYSTDSQYQFIWNGAAWLAKYVGLQATIPPLVGALAVVNAGSSTVTSTSGVLEFATPGVSGQVNILEKVMPGGAWTFTVGMVPNAQGTWQAGITLRDSASGRFSFWGQSSNASSTVAFYDQYLSTSSGGCFGSCPTFNVQTPNPYYLRIVNNGSNSCAFQVSSDLNTGFKLINTVTCNGWAVNIDRVGIGIISTGQAVFNYFSWAGV